MRWPFIILAGLLCLFIRPQVALAQILIEEGKVVLDVSAGETVSRSLSVHNTSDQLISVKAYWEDFMYVPPFDGTKKFMARGSSGFSLGQWMNFSPQEFELAAYAKKNINYVIKVPSDAKGGYYGVLFLEKVNPGVLKETGVKLVTRVGSLFFLETKNKQKQGQVGDLTMSAAVLQGKFFNTGDVILIPAGSYYVLDQGGLVVDRGTLDNLYLPPKETAQFSVNLKDYQPGQYTLVLTFDLGGGDSLVKEIDFMKALGQNFKVTQTRD